MFIKLKRFLAKFRVFKRIRTFKFKIEELGNLIILQSKEIRIVLNKLENAIKTKNVLYKERNIAVEKKDKATKHITEMVGKRNEFLKRIQGKIPDDMPAQRFDVYKIWLMEPFMEETFTPYVPTSSSEVFVEGYSAAKGLIEVMKDIKGKKDEDKTETD